MVDLVGIEPTTSSMPWKRAPSCATGPHRRGILTYSIVVDVVGFVKPFPLIGNRGAECRIWHISKCNFDSRLLSLFSLFLSPRWRAAKHPQTLVPPPPLCSHRR